ncbi:MAG: M48 family metalloprotease [Mycobacterium sp.]|jgi:hypothetical protein
MATHRPVPQSTTTEEHRREWVARVGEIAALLGQSTPPSVEFLPGPLGMGARYHHGTDTLGVTDGWISAEPDPWSLPSSALLAHELGHREELTNIRRARRLYYLAYFALVALLLGGCVAAFVSWTRESDGGLDASVWFPLFVSAVGVAVVVSMMVTSWPREYYADGVAARLFGSRGVVACLAVYAANGSRSTVWPSHTHPSHRMRIARQRRREAQRR